MFNRFRLKKLNRAMSWLMLFVMVFTTFSGALAAPSLAMGSSGGGGELASVYDTSYGPASSDLSPPGLLDSTGSDSSAPASSSPESQPSVNGQGSISLEPVTTNVNPVYPNFLDVSKQTTSQSSEILSTSHEESLLVPEAPTADPAPGNYNSTQLVNLRSSTVGASVYYTTDGSDPDPNSFLIIYPIQVDHNLTIKALAIKNGVCSPVSSFNYVIAPEPPVFSLAPGQYDLPQQLIISNGTGAGSIYYTLDGSEPMTSGMLYREPINIDRSLTVRALVYLDGQTGSEAVASYVIGIPSPVATPAAGRYSAPLYVTLQPGAEGASVYYTTDGSIPTPAGTLYSGPFKISKTTIIQAITVKNGISSPVASFKYELPSMRLMEVADTRINTGEIAGDNLATTGDEKWYSFVVDTPGMYRVRSYPGQGSPSMYYVDLYLYDASFNLLGDYEYRYYNGENFYHITRELAAGTYYVKATSQYEQGSYRFGVYAVPYAPAASPAPGLYTAAQSVSLETLTNGAVVYYTTDGTDPTGLSRQYNGTPVEVSATTTVKAVAWLNGQPSEIASFLYVISGSTEIQNIEPGQMVNGNIAATTDEKWYSFTAETSRYLVACYPGDTEPKLQSTSVGVTLYNAALKEEMSTSLWINESSQEAVGADLSAGAYYLKLKADSAGSYKLKLWPCPYQPATSPGPGAYGAAQNITLTCDTPGAEIYYSTGWELDIYTQGILYTTPLTIDSSSQLRALSVKDGVYSDVAYYWYTIILPPSANPASGEFNRDTLVSLSLGEGWGTIYYTTDGSSPTRQSTVYQEPVLVDRNMTIKAALFSYNVLSAPAEFTYTRLPGPPPPSADPVAGTYTGAVQVTLSCPEAPTIYYTTDGFLPGENSLLYTEPVLVNSSLKIRAASVKDGVYSNVADFDYSILLPPYADKESGSYVPGTTVSLYVNTAGAAILYTTDGSSPVEFGLNYTEPIYINNKDITLNAVSVKDGVYSAVVTYQYSAGAKVPTASPGPGTYNAVQSVTLNTSPGAVIYYTTNGTDPNPNNNPAAFLYENPVAVDRNIQIRAIASKNGSLSQESNAGSWPPGFNYNLTVPRSVYLNQTNEGYIPSYGQEEWLRFDAASYGNYAFVTQASSSSDRMYYGTYLEIYDGAMNYVNSFYNYYFYYSASPIYLQPGTYLIKVQGYYYSDRGRYLFTVTGNPVAAPLATPEPGSVEAPYDSSVTVELSSAEAGAAIHYTTNGADPTVNSPLYTGPVTLNQAGANNLKAISVINEGLSNQAVSDTAVFTYYIDINLPVVDYVQYSRTGDYYDWYNIYSGDPPTFNKSIYLRPQATDDTTVSVVYFTYSVDGIEWWNIGSTSNYEMLAWDTTPMSDGTYQMRVLARDPVSRESTPYVVQVNIDNTAPPEPSTFSLTPGPASFNLSWTATEGNQSYYRIYRGIIPDNLTYLNYTYSTSYTDVLYSVADTQYYYAVTAVDQFENESLRTEVKSGYPQLTPPVADKQGGSYPLDTTISLSTIFAGASILYTVDGSPPVTSGLLYTAPITISSSFTLKAVTVKNGVYSDEAVYVYTALSKPPAASPAPGNYSEVQLVTLSTSPGADIYYTLNGSTPTTDSTRYIEGQPILVDHNIQIRAISYDGSMLSQEANASGYPIGFNYYLTVQRQAYMNGTYECYIPNSYQYDWFRFEVAAAGRYKFGTQASVLGDQMYDTYLYLYDNSMNLLETDDDDGPGAYSLIDRSIDPGTYIIKVGGWSSNRGRCSFFVSGKAPAPVVAAESPQPNTADEPYDSSVEVSLTTSAPDGAIYYTTDGTTPASSSSLYTGPVTLSQPGTNTIRAITVTADGSSDVAVFTYYVDVNPPVVNNIQYSFTGGYWDWNTFYSGYNPTLNKNIHLRALASDDTTISRVYFSYSTDGAAWTDINYSSGTNEIIWETSLTGSDGNYLLRAQALDPAGHQSDFYQVSLVLDNTPPDLPQNLVLTPGQARFDLSWTAPASGGVSSYNIYRGTSPENMEKIGYTYSTAYGDNLTVSESVYYCYTVAAVDQYANESELVPVVGGYPEADTTLPQVTGFWPDENNRLRGNIGLSLSAADNAGIKQAVFEIMAAGGSSWTTLGTYSYGLAQTSIYQNCSINTLSYADRGYRIRVSVTDYSDNTVSILKNMEFDNTAPPAVSNLTAAGVPGAVKLFWSPAGAGDVARYEIFRATTSDGFSSYSYATVSADVYTYTDRNVTVGSSYWYKVRAVDQSRNYSYDSTGNAGLFSSVVTGVPQQYEPSVTVEPAGQMPGQQLTVKALGFKPYEYIRFYIDDASSPFSSYWADENGNLTATYTIPANMSGRHSFKATGDTTQLAALKVYTIGLFSPLIEITPLGAKGGDRVTLSAGGFAPGEYINFYLDDSYIGYAYPDGNAFYTFGYNLGIPLYGQHVFKASGSSSSLTASVSYYVYSRSPVLEINPAAAGGGEQVALTASGFAPNEYVHFFLDGSDIGYGYTYGGGTCSLNYTLGKNLSGEYMFKARGDYSLLNASLTYKVVSRTPVLEITPAGAKGGELVTLNASGFAPNEYVHFFFDGVDLGYNYTYSGGACSIGYSLGKAVNGEHIFKARGDDSGKNAVVTYLVPSRTPSLTVTQEPQPGTGITLNADGFAPNEYVHFFYNGSDIGSQYTYGTGACSLNYTIPADTAAPYYFFARGG